MIYKNDEGKTITSHPYVPIQVSSIENGMNANSKPLVDTGADRGVISHNLVKKLNMEISPTNIRAKDASGRLLPLLGDVTLQFSCDCCHHK